MDALVREGLPPGWAQATLETVCEINPATDITAIPADEAVTFVPMAAVGAMTNVVDTSKMRPLREVTTGFTRFQSGDVIFAKITPCMENGKIALVPELPNGIGIGSTEFHVLRPKTGIDASYVCHYLMQETFRATARRSMSGAVGQQRVPAAFLREATLPVPPAAEQTRIVAAVNALFEEVEAGDAALARAREGLTQFRASLLHAACTGALTADWRAANPTNETGHDLLTELLAERRERWEAEFRAKAARAGKRLRDDTWKTRYPTPRSPDLADMPELPDGWTWTSLDQLAHDSNYGTSVKCDADADGLAVLRIPNVQAGAVTWSNLKFATGDLGLEPTDLLAPGDLLVVRTNGSPYLVGRAALIEGQPERLAYFASYLIRFRLLGSATVRRWVASVFRSGLVRTQIARFAATSAGQYNVSQTNLAGFAIPLPPKHEIEAALDALTEAAADDGALPPAGFADQLRQSILHAAFTGRLVPQDPADEPAAALLGRLRAAPTTTRRPRQRRAAAQPDLIETPA